MNVAIAWIKQILLFVHVIAFAFALVEIAREDVRLLSSPRLDIVRLESVARMIAYLLCVLWFSGLGLILLDSGFDLSVLIAKPKLAIKLTVVSLLTINGLLLSCVVFPMFVKPQSHPELAAAFAASLGAVSSVTWIFAAFLGVARMVAPLLGHRGLLFFYGVALSVGFLVAQVAVRPRLVGHIPRRHATAQSSMVGVQSGMLMRWSS